MVVSFDLVEDEDKMPMMTQLDLSAVLNSIKHGTWGGWVEIAVLGEHSYTVRFSMEGIFLPLFLWSASLKIFEFALSFCATDG